MESIYNMKNKLIALYLPQYHPTPRNDKWWGKGFTEWTNVGKAKPLYPGHYQPHVPADLGYYDLRLPETRKAQADMAREYGVYGFCYYHYWFEDGFEELERPFYEVVESGEPDFPFCLCWANESWYSKFWNLDGTVGGKKCLAEQKYLGREDNEKHFYKLLKAFKDHRYIKHDGKLLFIIYKPLEFVGIHEFMEQWQGLAKENGLPEFNFMGVSSDVKAEYDAIRALGIKDIITTDLNTNMQRNMSLCDKIKLKLYRKIHRKAPTIIDYSKYYPYLTSLCEDYPELIPSIYPNWDHSPRSGSGSTVLENATPENFEKHVKLVSSILNKKNEDESLCFLKSWNEWGEGNYVEPDLRYGLGFLEIIKKYFK